MSRSPLLALTLALAGLPAAALAAHPFHDPHLGPGRLVGISVEIDSRPARLYPAPDGTDRWYLEAQRGRAYAIRLTNRSRLRLGVELKVDGLNVISGEAPEPNARGRLYVLQPGDSTLVRGWRSSLQDVQRFAFVDEERSYAVRAEKSGARLGWIEARVFREHRPRAVLSEAAPPPHAPAPAHEESAEAGESASADRAQRREPSARGRAYPGTGWGDRVGDRAVLVDFHAETTPAESVALRYEYADALHALGVLPEPGHGRLWERERGDTGFARPPRR